MFVHATHQARSQVLRFRGAKYILGGTIFVFIIFLKQTFLGTRKFGGHCPRTPPRGYGLATHSLYFYSFRNEIVTRVV